MNKYTAEQVAREADLQEDRVADMLRDYAALLRERESVKAEVTDREAFSRGYVRGYAAALGAAASECRRQAGALDHGGNEYIRYADAIKCAAAIGSLRAPELNELSGNSGQLPMPASARVPDEWVRRLSAPITPEELKRAWNMIGQAHPQKEWVERALIGFIELRITAALEAVAPMLASARVAGDGAFSRGYVRGYEAALGAAAAECRRQAGALDHGGNEYIRYVDAIKCAAAIGALHAPELNDPSGRLVDVEIPDGAFVIDRGFQVEHGQSIPTVLVGFRIEDWKARDTFASMLVAAPKPETEE